MECPKCSFRINLTCSVCKVSPVVERETVIAFQNLFSGRYRVKCTQCIQHDLGEVAFSKKRAIGEAPHVSHSKNLSQLNKKLSKLNQTLGFLKLQAPDPYGEPDVLNGDVTLLLQGGDAIRAHRFILAEKSPVFRRMFSSEMTESKSGVISVDDASYAAMQAVVKFCYTAEVDFTESVHAEEVLRVAHKYQISHLPDRCVKELGKRISKDNLIEIMKLSRDCEAKKLLEASGEYIREHFGECFRL